MRFTVWHHRTEVTYENDSERSLVESILYFKDPNASTIREYKEGTWDGMRDFFFDAERSVFPTGLLKHVLVILTGKGVTPELVDERTPTPVATAEITPDFLNGVTLRPYQVDAINTVLRKKRGVVNVAPRGGKTEIQIAVAAALNVRSILCVEKASLMQQHYERFRERGVMDVGRYGEGHKEFGAQHLVATFQSLHSAYRRSDKQVEEWLNEVELAQGDEVHHLGHAPTYYKAFNRIPCVYRVGYSGTPFRVKQEDFHFADFHLMGTTGPRIVHVNSRFLRDEGYLVEPTVFMVKINRPAIWHLRNWQNVYKAGVVENEQRNGIIVKLAKMLHEAGEKTLILIRELKHGETLLTSLNEEGVPCLMASGGKRITTYVGGSCRRSSAGIDKVRELIQNGSISTVVGSTIFDEGVDLPELTALIMGTSGRDSIRTIQRAFRAMTAASGKTESRIFDFYDNISFMLRNQSRERMKTYKEEDIKVVSQLPASFRRAIGAPS